MYDNKNHLLRSHIIALMNYLKSNECVRACMRAWCVCVCVCVCVCGWMCVCVLDQVLPSLMRLYTKKTEICSSYRLAAGEKILHMESFALLN